MQAVGKKMGDFNADTGISKFSCCCSFCLQNFIVAGCTRKGSSPLEELPLGLSPPWWHGRALFWKTQTHVHAHLCSAEEQV